MKEKIDKVPFYVTIWIYSAVIITLLAGLAYVAVQQSVRQAANQTPAQIIQEVVNALKQGAQPDQIVQPATVDVADAPSAFVAIFDSQGKTLGSSVQVQGKTPSLSSGIFDAAKKNGENRFTWQPESNAREAVIVAPYSAASSTSGYVLAGQSLKETEKIEHNISMLCAFGWLVSIVIAFLLSFLLFRTHESKHHHEHMHETVV